MQELIELQIEALRPSPTNPRDPNEEPDTELTQSIRDNGVIQPLIVRPQPENGDIAYEIAAGHRRRINARAAGLSTVPCIVRELTDDQMIDFHVQENIHRKDLGPMEEARTYKLMKDRGNTHAEIALRAAKSVPYIAKFLKLNDLIPELQTDVAAGVLPLTHTFILCKYSADAQEATMRELYGGEWVLPDFAYEVDEDNGLVYDKEGNQIEDSERLDEIFEAYSNLEQVWTVDKTRLQYTANKLENYLVNQFTLRLDKAIFDLKDKRLRTDKLTCPACPERTGANATLFDMAEDSPDFCLNRKCFEAKTQTFVELVRRDVAKKADVAIEQVPVVVDSWNVVGAPEGWTGKQGVDFLTFESDEEDFEPDEHCEFERTAIFNGQPVTICHVSSGCQTHHWQNRPEYKAVNAGANLTDEEREAKAQAAKRARKEELWNVKVAEEARQRIVVEAAKKFAEGIGLNFDTRLIEIRTVMLYTTARLWQTKGYNEDTNLKLFTAKAGIELPATMYGFDYEEAVAGLDIAIMRQLYFILTHFWKGAMNKSWASQEKVVELATRHGINYKLVDAQVRVEISAKKHEKRHKAYLQQIEVNDPDAQIPLLYTQVEKVEEKTEDIPTDTIPVNATEATDAVDIVEEKTEEISEPDKTEAFEVAGAVAEIANTEAVAVPESVLDQEAPESAEIPVEGQELSPIDVVCSECARMPGFPCMGPRGQMIGYHDARRKLFAPVEYAEGSQEAERILRMMDRVTGKIIDDKKSEIDTLQEIADASDGHIVIARPVVLADDPALFEAIGPCDDESEEDDEELDDEGDAFGEAPEQLDMAEDARSLENSAKSLSDLFDEAIGG